MVIIGLVVGSIQHSYSPVRQTLSALVLGRFGWLETAAFVIFGFLLCIFAWRIYASVIRKSPVLKIATVLLLAVGAGFFLISISPTQPEGSAVTMTSRIHFITVMVISVFTSISFFLLAFSFKKDGKWKGIFNYTLITAIISTSLGFFGPFWAFNSNWEGLYERIFLLNGLIWIEVVSFRLVTICRADFPNCCKLNIKRRTES